MFSKSTMFCSRKSFLTKGISVAAWFLFVNSLWMLVDAGHESKWKQSKFKTNPELFGENSGTIENNTNLTPFKDHFFFSRPIILLVMPPGYNNRYPMTPNVYPPTIQSLPGTNQVPMNPGYYPNMGGIGGAMGGNMPNNMGNQIFRTNARRYRKPVTPAHRETSEVQIE